MAFEFTDQNFQSAALQSSGVSVVDFWAEWCGPEYGENVNIGKLNVDNNPQVSMQFGVRSIPTILFIKNGEVVDKHVGTTTKASLKQKIDSLL